MASRRLLLLVLSFAAACTQLVTDVKDQLPVEIGGQTLVYQVTVGSSPDGEYWRPVAESVGVRPDVLTIYEGDVDERLFQFKSTYFHAPGVGSAALLDATIERVVGPGPRRTDTIAGKALTRALQEGMTDFDLAPYFYAFGDTAVAILADERSALEAFGKLP